MNKNDPIAQELLNTIRRHHKSAFINKTNEMIVHPNRNIYFQLDNAETKQDLKAKCLAWLSRPAHKGESVRVQKTIQSIVNDYLNTDFSVDDFSLIYIALGLNNNPDLTIKFIESNYELNLLR